ncbi:ageIM, partial [Symbiodinium necroappetens]
VPKGKAKSNTKVTKEPRGQSDQPPRRVSTGSEPSAAPKMLSLTSNSSLEASSTGGVVSEILLADGRAKRAYNTLKAKADEYLDTLGKIQVDDAIPDAHQRASWKNSLMQRTVQLKTIVKGSKDLVRRTLKSANKDSFGEPLQRLEQIEVAAQSLEKLFNTASADQPDPEQMVEAYDSCGQSLMSLLKSFTALGPVFRLKYILAKGNLHCLYQEYDKFSRLFLWRGDELEEMESFSGVLGQDMLKQHVVTEVENRVILALRGAQQPELQSFASAGTLDGGLLEAYSLSAALIACEEAEGTNFIPTDLLGDLAMVQSILTLGAQDLKHLAETTATLHSLQEKLESKAAADSEEADTKSSAIPRFFVQHAAGKILMDVACGRVEAGKKETDAECAVSAFQEAVQALPVTHPRLLDDIFVPAIAKYQAAFKLCQDLKKKHGKDKGLAAVSEKQRATLENAKTTFLEHVEKSSVTYLREQFRPVLFCVCEALENDGKVSHGEADAKSMHMLSLEETWPLAKQTAFVTHTVWKDLPGKADFLARYEKFVGAFCNMAEYLFRQLPSFQHLPKAQPAAASMRYWANKLPQDLQEWVVEKDAVEVANKTCFQRCAELFQAAFSAGLTAVAQVVAQAKTGDTPLTQQSVDELLSKLPSDHALRGLCVAFFQVVLCNPAQKDSKDIVDLKLCATSLQDMGSKLQEVRGKLSRDATIADDLKCSQLDSVDDWLVSVSNNVLTRVKPVLSQGLARVKAVSTDLGKFLEKLRDFSDEVAFRDSGVKVVQKMAGLVAKLEQSLSSVRENLDTAGAVMQLRFSAQAPDSDLCESCKVEVQSAQQELENGGLASARAGTVVALVANLCLLRSPDLSKPSPTPQSLKQLGDVVTTLEGKLGKFDEMAKIDDYDEALKSFGERIVTESNTLLAQQTPAKGKKRKAEETQSVEHMEVSEDADDDKKKKTKDPKTKAKGKNGEVQPKPKKEPKAKSVICAGGIGCKAQQTQQVDMPPEPERKKPRTIGKKDSCDEPVLMVEASRRVVAAEHIQDGTLLHRLALENLEKFKALQPGAPLGCGQGRQAPHPMVLTWASACSGSEGMYYVAEAINAAYACSDVPVKLKHVFSCESAAEKQKWIQAILSVGPLREPTSDSWPPPLEVWGGEDDGGEGHCLFSDILELFQVQAKCCRHKKGCDVPSVDLLVVGTSCKDVSKMNTGVDRSAPVFKQASSRGGSAQTFQGLLGYVQSHRPLCIVYENVDTISDQPSSAEESNLKVLLGKFESLGYEGQPVMTDACEFGLPCHRHRVYVFLVNKRSPKLCLLSRPLADIMHVFRQLVSSCTRSPPCFSAVLLPNDHPAVKLSLEERQARAEKSQSSKSKSSKQGPDNWVNLHMKFADSLQVRWGSAPGSELQSNPHFQVLTRREADALTLSEVESPNAGFRNLSQSVGRINFNSLRDDGTHLGPTMLPGQLLWTTLAKPHRLLTGYEAMLMQGFPIESCIERLDQEAYVVRASQATSKEKAFPTDALLQELAGNAMALPVLLAFAQSGLAAVWLRAPEMESNASSVEVALDAMLLMSGGLGPGALSAPEDEDEDEE